MQPCMGGDMKKAITIGLASLAFAGCANLNSIHQTANLPDGRSHLIDAKQRAIVVWPLEEPHTVAVVQNRGKPGDGKIRSVIEDRYSHLVACAEPSPDAFSVLATSGEFSITGQTGASAAGSLASTETGASLVRRTTTIQALRDAYFRLCEAHANGAIDDIDLMIGQRHNQTMLLGMLAVEQLTGAMAAPAVAIGGSAEAVSASAIQSVATARTAEAKKEAELKTKIADKETAANEADDRVTAINELLAEDPVPAPGKASLEKEKIDKAAQRDALTNELPGLKIELETTTKTVEALTKALERATETGSMAASAVPVFLPTGSTGAGTSTQADIAKTVENIVRALNSNDFGPTICLRSERSHEATSNTSLVVTGDNVELSSVDTDGKCSAILAAYVRNIEDNADVSRATAKLINRIADLPVGQLSNNLELVKLILNIRATQEIVAKVNAENGIDK